MSCYIILYYIILYKPVRLNVTFVSDMYRMTNKHASDTRHYFRYIKQSVSYYHITLYNKHDDLYVTNVCTVLCVQSYIVDVLHFKSISDLISLY